MEPTETARDFARVARVKMLAASYDADETTIADRLYSSSARTRHIPKMMHEIAIQKSGIGAGGLGSADWGKELLAASRVSAAFSAAVRTRSVLGQLAFVPAPFDTALTWVMTRVRAKFVGERAAYPSLAPAFKTAATLKPKKIGGLVACSRELLEAPDADAAIERELIGACVEGEDVALLDVNASESDAQPASVASLSDLFYDGTAATTVATIDALLSGMAGHAIYLGSNLATTKWITSVSNCVGLATMRTAVGGPRAFPEMSAAGGVLLGLPVIATAYGPSDQIVLVDGSEILVATDPQTTIVNSTEAVVDQSSPTDGSRLVSMFQTDSVAIKVTRTTNWIMRNEFVVTAKNFTVTLGTPSTTA